MAQADLSMLDAYEGRDSPEVCTIRMLLPRDPRKTLNLDLSFKNDKIVMTYLEGFLEKNTVSQG